MKDNETKIASPSDKKEVNFAPKNEQTNPFKIKPPKHEYGKGVYVHHNFDDPYGKFH